MARWFVGSRGSAGNQAVLGAVPAQPAPIIASTLPHLASGPGLQLAVGLLVGALVWTLHPARTNLVAFPRALRRVSMQTMSQEPERRILARRWDYTNCSATVGLIGLLASGAFGLAEGAARRSWRGAVAGLVFGALVGAAAGAGAGWMGRYFYDWVAPRVDEIPRGMLLQAMMWGALGTVVGFSMALPTRRLAVMLRCAFAAALAGLVSAMLFGILAAHFFPLENNAFLVPRGHSRILWTVLTTALMGVLGGWYGAQHNPSKSANTA